MSDFLTDYRRGLETRIASEMDSLMKASDWPDFQKRRGVILGLQSAVDALDEQVKKAHRDDEEDDEE